MKNLQELMHSRRNFLKTGSKAAVGVGLASTVAGSVLLKSCTPSASTEEVVEETDVETFTSVFKTGFTQTPLQYAYNELEPNIDAQTMEIHYTKHAAGYSKNLIEAASEEGIDPNTSVEEILKSISKYSTKLRNNAGGHYNHELFWSIMSPTAQSAPEGTLAKYINNTFGSFETFVSLFEDEAKGRFGSGWAWLVFDKGTLKICSTPNQDNPLMDVSECKGTPLMGLDVWEHAYYLNYQNRRPDYIKSWWNVLDWKKVQERYDLLIAGMY